MVRKRRTAFVICRKALCICHKALFRVLLLSRGFLGRSDGKESACHVEDPALVPWSGRSPGEGNSHPLQCSCLGNPMDRGVWRATVSVVSESQTRLSNFHCTENFYNFHKRSRRVASQLTWMARHPNEPTEQDVWVRKKQARLSWFFGETDLKGIETTGGWWPQLEALMFCKFI